uniref:Uncharacterized protein n=1 Tax=Myoviridae sp. ctkmZ20 TaxID=2825166 RepID=A0A8S5NUK8_9CAUD|nr:MAG TPA: hypothetical protein [Myoviridae sp. ctkmZ20]
MAHQNGIHYAEIVIFEVVLFQDRKSLAWSHFYCTLVWFKVAADSAEECRFSGAVSTDDTINITMSELEVYILVKHSLSKLDCKILYCNHLNFISPLLSIIYKFLFSITCILLTPI